MIRIVSISNIHPAGACWLEHTLYLIENVAELYDEVLKARLKSKLALHTIVAQCPIRRAGDYAINVFIGKLLQYLVRIPAYYSVDEMIDRNWHEKDA